MLKIILLLLMLGVVRALPSSSKCKGSRCKAVQKVEQREIEISREMRKKNNFKGYGVSR